MSFNEDHSHEGPRLPVTIVTGFLGAGKTTLLQKLVRECQGQRIAVIQNEVSEEMGIETSLLTDSSGNIIPDFFELPNGCICCTSKDDMVTALENVVSLGHKIDAVFVETTGVADPCSVAEIFWVDSALNSSVYLDGVVAVVDCVNFPKVLQEDHFMHHHDIARKQIAIADKVIMNKCDLGTSEEQHACMDLISSLNPTAEVISATRSSVDPSVLMNIGTLKDLHGLLAEEECDDHEHCSHHRHSELSSVDHVLLRYSEKKIFDPHLLESAVGEIVWFEETTADSHVGKVYRVKGLFVNGSDEWFLLQGVGSLFEVTRVEKPPVDRLNWGKFLFIGTDLNESELRRALEKAAIVSVVQPTYPK